MKKFALALVLTSLATIVYARPADDVVLYVEPSEMGTAITAALIKKHVPVQITVDADKATHVLNATTDAKQEGTGERMAKVVMLGAFAGSGKSRDTSITIADKKSGAIVFAYNTRKADKQSAAEGVAKNLKKFLEDR